MSGQQIALQLIVMFVLLLLSALFSASETAFSSLNRGRLKSCAERGDKHAEAALALDELTECIPAAAQTERTLEQKELVRAVERFLHGLPQTEQQVFICRYWYLDSIAQISRRFHFSESKVKSMLHRTRERLKVRLIREGLIDECR